MRLAFDNAPMPTTDDLPLSNQVIHIEIDPVLLGHVPVVTKLLRGFQELLFVGLFSHPSRDTPHGGMGKCIAGNGPRSPCQGGNPRVMHEDKEMEKFNSTCQDIDLNVGLAVNASIASGEYPLYTLF